MRQFILLLLILVPTAVYVGYMLSTRQSFDRLKNGPWAFLIASGVVLYGAALGVWALTGDPAGGRYIPPRVEDGVVIPGRHEPAEDGASDAGAVPVGPDSDPAEDGGAAGGGDTPD